MSTPSWLCCRTFFKAPRESTKGERGMSSQGEPKFMLLISGQADAGVDCSRPLQEAPIQGPAAIHYQGVRHQLDIPFGGDFHILLPGSDQQCSLCPPEGSLIILGIAYTLYGQLRLGKGNGIGSGHLGPFGQQPRYYFKGRRI